MSVKLTAFGVYARKLRLDRNEFLKDMAKQLGITPTYLSAVERGRRNAPYDWVECIAEKYNLNGRDRDELSKAISDSRYYDKLDISHLDFEDKQLVYEIVKELPDLKNTDRNKIMGAITNG